jgi:diguanylate cyclase (GGDEF)-like protein
MSRDEYLHWRTKVAISSEATDSIVELKNGRTFKIRHRPMPDGGWVATHEDITEQRQSEVKIEYMAHHDALTDLANRVLLNERLEHALGRSINREEMVAVHHLDLDQFKAVNDTFGHPAGDKLLKIVADRLRGLVRETDTIARTGGDEFVIVQAPIKAPAAATSLAQSIISLISEPFDLDGHQAVIGASIGIAVSPGDGLRPDKLLRNADLALYRAKGDGRGTFRFFEPAMDLQMQTRRIMEQDLRKALPAGEFELYYQPVLNLANNEISGFEALIRWNHPRQGLIAPGTFIPLAEEIGFIVPMGEWVIRQACATAARWPEDIHVAVNISAAQFRSPGLMQVIVGALATSGLQPTRLEIEITETVLLHNREATLAVLHQLRELGIRIAMDDFGTGYSSLTYLQCFPFDKIKIDRSFVKDITENTGSLNIVRAVAALARDMGLTATAEGVETSEQLERVTSEGCTEMQGFLFSRPLPAHEIERLFLAGREARSSVDRIVAA